MKRNSVFAAVCGAAAAHRLLSVGTLLCAAASVLASLLPPLLLARVIDGLTGGIPLTFAAALLYFGSLALEGVLASAQETMLEILGQKMTHALRAEMSQKLTRLPAATLSAQNPGELAARFSGDVDTVEALFTSGVISMAADACRILSILAVIAVKNAGLALILLPVLPLLAAFTRHVQRRTLAAQMENRRAVAAISAQVPEALHNIRTIRALGLEDYMSARYDRRIGESYAAVEKTNFYDAVYSPVVLTLNAAVVGVVMLLSASGDARVLTLFGMSVGTSVAVINYISRIFAPIESLGMEIQTIQSAMAGVKRINAFLAQPERAAQAAESAAVPRGDVAVDHVTFGYGGRTVLSDLSFTVKAGEQATLVGRTGAGKSTVFKLLLGLYRPEKGTVTIGGVDVSQITDRQRRSCIGCVEQHFARVPGTVLDQITLGDPRITRDMARKAARLAGLDAAICAFPDGYDTRCTDGMFSQGEWQLLSIARAAAADPAVLLLDEITANLDAQTEARVLEALRRASAGRTVISISHRIYEQLGGRMIEIRALDGETGEGEGKDLNPA
ncbi:MAG: ABC transporter ATP-binding protein [Christensenellales bacterium]|nr:ABC transporter ATP-binding protein [Christensenellales bacterium]